VDLTSEDKQLLIDLSWESQLPADPVNVTHFLSFPLNPEGARAANAELKDLGFETWLLTESEGDDFWHIAAVRVQSLDAKVVAKTRLLMESLALRHSGRYDDWDVTDDSRTRADWQMRSRLLKLRASRSI
jgi:hypothetical protein